MPDVVGLVDTCRKNDTGYGQHPHLDFALRRTFAAGFLALGAKLAL